MLRFFMRTKAMPGGLVFGPAAWTPGEMLNAPAGAAQLPHEQSARAPHTRAELVGVLERLGIGRTSGVTPALVEQLRDLEGRRCRALVLNLLPTQPEFALSEALSRLAIEDLRAGLSAIQRSLRGERVIAAVDKHDGRTRKLWRQGARNRPGHEATPYEVRPLLNRYPQAHPTLLIRALFGRRLQVGHLPSRNNRVLLDPVTAWAFGRYVRTGELFTHRPVQLFFDRASAPPNTKGPPTPLLVLAKLGAPVVELLNQYHIRTAQRQIIANGMLAGEEVAVEGDSGAVVTAWTDSLAVREPPVNESPYPCIACGWCVDVCPTSLIPIHLMELADRAQRFVAAAPLTPGGGLPTSPDPLGARAAREALHCLGCGLCSYVCPTRLPLTQKTLRLRAWVVAEPGREGV